MASTENKLNNTAIAGDGDSVASTGTEKSPTKSSVANGAPDIDERKLEDFYCAILPIVSMAVGVCVCVEQAARVIETS